MRSRCSPLPVLSALLLLSSFAQASTQTTDRLDARIYDFANFLSPSDWLALEQTARELEAGTENHFVVVIFEKKTDDGERALAEIEDRWRIREDRTVLFASYIDSVMIIRRSPALEASFKGDVAVQIISKRMVPFYASNQVVRGLISGMYAADSVVTGRMHPTLAVEEPSSPVEKLDDADGDPDDDVKVVPPTQWPWYARLALLDETDRARLVAAPLWQRIVFVPFLAILSFMGTIMPFGLIFPMIFTAIAARHRWLMLLWIPLSAAALWTMSADVIGTCGIVTLLVLVNVFRKKAT